MKAQSLQETTLHQIFPEGEIYAVSDCEWMRIAAAYYGLQGVAVEDSSKLPPDASVVLFLRTQLVSSRIRQQFPQARVLVVPVASFDSSLEAALYTQKLVTRTDYVAACAQGRYWVDSITSKPGPLVFRSEVTHLTCSFSDELSAAAWLEPAIGPGQWVSVGSFCELSFSTPPSRNQESPFSLNGTIVATGVLVARDGHFTEAGDARIKAAEKLRRELVAAAPITLHLADGVLTSVCAGGRDFTDAVRQATNPEHGLQALELGIGTNQSVLPDVLWEFNSQLNEGAGPVHLGFGEGVSGAHMDFIVADGSHEFVTSSE